MNASLNLNEKSKMTEIKVVRETVKEETKYGEYIVTYTRRFQLTESGKDIFETVSRNSVIVYAATYNNNAEAQARIASY